MEILAHRGYWLQSEERNTSAAFERAFADRFGVETDIRDLGGELVVSHDPALEGCMKTEDFFRRYKTSGCRTTLALNIKSDGLQQLLSAQLAHFEIKNYFVFDMSVPDLLQSLRAGLNCFTRISDIERADALSAQVSGVWLDCFDSDWFGEREILELQQSYPKVAIVSPELHGRSHLPIWEELKQLQDRDKLMLCTDFPQDARAFFA